MSSQCIRLLSVNVARPRTVQIAGRDVATGIYKEPVEGLVRVSALNLAGDAQADLTVHGGADKAVYLYPWAHVLYWRKELGREDLGPGTFGENLTVQGLDETDTALGDELEIGTARFLVTRPRLPCYKLTHKLGIAEFDTQFLRSGRTGFYLRVLREGTLKAGDEVRRAGSSESERMTIAEFLRMIDAEVLTAEQVGQLQRLRSLSESWKHRLAQKMR